MNYRILTQKEKKVLKVHYQVNKKLRSLQEIVRSSRISAGSPFGRVGNPSYY